MKKCHFENAGILKAKRSFSKKSPSPGAKNLLFFWPVGRTAVFIPKCRELKVFKVVFREPFHYPTAVFIPKCRELKAYLKAFLKNSRDKTAVFIPKCRELKVFYYFRSLCGYSNCSLHPKV
jgi:hypothetical protein